MKSLVFALMCLMLCALGSEGLLGRETERQPTIDVKGPAVVAFFPPVTDQELEKDPDTNEVLADFQLYASRVREPFKKAGIAFHELYVHSFRLRAGKKVTTFRPSKVNVGYYFVAPGKKPRIEYGVMTDGDLFQVAREYFGISGGN